MTTRVLAAVCVVPLLLSACGTNASAPREAADLFATLLSRSDDLGPLEPDASVPVVVSLRGDTSLGRNIDQPERYTPGSPAFGTFETPAGYASTHGPDPALVSEVDRAARAAGLTLEWQPGNPWAILRGPVGRVEAMFAVGIRRYRAGGGTPFYASVSDPAVPASLAPWVAAVGRITDYRTPRPKAVPRGGLKPVDLLSAYNVRPLRDQGIDGTGETIVFLEVDGYDQRDLDAFTAKFSLPPIVAGERGGALQQPKADGETTMDLEVAHAIAPGATLVLYTVNPRASGADFLKVIDRMVSDNPRAVISISLGGCEQAMGPVLVRAQDSAFGKATLLGESVFVSSGDSGAYECLTQDWNAQPNSAFIGVPSPASSAGVTAVGGTRISVRQDGTYYNETAWSEPATTAGTGGGPSRFISRPAWQRAPGVDAAPGTGMRLVPDVAVDADPASGMAIVVNGKPTVGGGTSQSAPIWAAMTALINQYLKRQGVPPVGFMNPALYALASGRPLFPPFHDVTVGTNLAYPAGPGYDLATGLGTPDVWNLARDLEAYQRAGSR